MRDVLLLADIVHQYLFLLVPCFVFVIFVMLMLAIIRLHGLPLSTKLLLIEAALNNDLSVILSKYV